VTHEYDANGNPPTVTTYDSTTRTFPETITNPLGHAVNYLYDYRYGKVKEAIDANDHSTYFDYDEFGRIKKVDYPPYPDGGQVITGYYDDVFPRYRVTRIKEDTFGSVINSYNYFDGLGREIQTITLGEGNKAIVTKSFYDPMGRKDLVEGPFFESSRDYAIDPPTDLDHPLNPSGAYPWKQTTFDHLSRPETIESADGEYGSVVMTFSYSGLSTTITDPDNSQKTETKDHLGRIVEGIEHADEKNLMTTYVYNAAGDLLQVKDHYGNTTTVSYDTLGRKSSINDPDMGFWEYTYDANGNLVTQTDAKLQTITYSYDGLNRIRLKTYSTEDPEVTYNYDNNTIPNGIGRLYSVSNAKVTTTYDAYDEIGNVTRVSKKIIDDPAAYTTQYVYDLSGKVTRTTYPDGYQVTNTYYPGTGLLESVRGGARSKLLSYISNYTPGGKIGRLESGNTIVAEYAYDAESTRLLSLVTNALQRVSAAFSISTSAIRSSIMPEKSPPPTMVGIVASPQQGILQSKIYQYTPAGNIKEITDKVKGITYTYTYDKLHRLTGETNTGTYDLISYTYDAIGNLMSKTVGSSTMTYTYGSVHKHAVKTINFNGVGHGYNYDGNGNMTVGSDFTDPDQIAPRTITYNADNMPDTISHTMAGNTLTTNFVYDGVGVRAKKTVNGGGSIYYIGDHYEIKDGIATKYVFAGNLRIAMIKGADVIYYHKDHLGSSTVMTDASGNMLETTDYMPFGAQRDNSGPYPNITHYRFTGQELDVESGLYNYNARLYDPVIGRFISADVIVPNPFDPQDLNRYTYVRNNPLIYVDPSGHHYGTDGPGGKADFGGETVSGEQNDSVSGPRGDAGWGDFFDSSKSYTASPAATEFKLNEFQRKIDRLRALEAVKELTGFWDKVEFALGYLFGYYGYKSISTAYAAHKAKKALDASKKPSIRWDQNSQSWKDTVTGKPVKGPKMPKGFGKSSTWKEGSKDVTNETIATREGQKSYEKMRDASIQDDFISAFEHALKDMLNKK
jgi:RHS repeat-associated protein